VQDFWYLFTVSSLCFFSPLFSVSTFCVSPLFDFCVFYSVLCFIFCALFLYSVLSELLFSCCVLYFIFCFFLFYKISYNIVNGNYTSVVTRVKERFPGSGSIEVCFSMPGGGEDCTTSKLSQEKEKPGKDNGNM
jgi:hypothetical protein